jgi:response regulator of citrate/malate metabolism
MKLNKGYKMTKKEFLKQLEKLLTKEELKNREDIFILIGKYENSSKTTGRQNAAYTATEARSKKVKEKIQNAINLLRMQGKEITAYAVAKEAGISFVTARKYLNMFNEIK